MASPSKSGKKPYDDKGKHDAGKTGTAKEHKTADVEAQSLLYTCWACGSLNVVPSYWNSFSCWRCGALNIT
jgi:hypothetical protein